MEVPDTVHQIDILNPKTYLIKSKNLISSSADPIIPILASDAVNPLEDYEIQDLANRVQQKNLTVKDKIQLFWPLKKYMVPLCLVYIGEYLINQGLTELIYFDCSHGFDLSKHSQYRWFQVIYQLGAFFSRSSVQFFTLPQFVLYLLPILQIGNTIFLAFDAIYFFVPHIAIIFSIILFEGTFGGAAYGNTFHRIHNEVASDVREFSMSATTLADSGGIVIAALSAIPLHNFICNQQNIRIKP
uniref:Battenin n=1 Tax=Panagrolaimus davidi TaxID=227884 RepID=A0A914R5B7_9BILA